MPHLTINLKAILDNLPENLVLISPDHKVITFNKAIQKALFALFEKNLDIDADYRDFVSSENKNTYLNNFQKAIDGEHIVLQIQVKSGDKYIWHEYEMFPVYNDDQKLIGVTLKFKNVDQEKRAEIELEKLTETVNAIFESTTESILLIDKDYTLLSFNKAAADRIKNGLQKNLCIGADFRDYLYDKGQDAFYDMFIKAASGEASIIEVETIDTDGNPIWLHTKMHPTHKKNGDLLGICIVSYHITEKKLAELALKESEKKFKKIVESAPMPIIICGDQTNIILANPETEKVFGYSSNELLNQNIELLIPHFQTQHTNINRCVPASRKNGEEIMIQASLSNYRLNNKTYTIAIILDVTQRIQDEQQIATQLKRLQEIAWQQSHEIRRPLTNILGAYDLIQLETAEEEKQKHLDSLYLSAKELDNVIHQIVDYTN